MRHEDTQVRNHVRDDDAAAMRAAGFDLKTVGSTVAIRAIAPDGGITYFVDGVKIAFHKGDPMLRRYSVVSRKPSPTDVCGRACFDSFADAVAYVKATH